MPKQALPWNPSRLNRGSCYNYPLLKGGVRAPILHSVQSVALGVQRLPFSQAIAGFVVRANYVVLTVRSSVSVGFIHQGPGSVSANIIHCSSHTSKIIDIKSVKKLIKTSTNIVKILIKKSIKTLDINSH